MASRIAPELEITIIDSDNESRPDSPLPQETAQRVAAAAHAEFTPRAIPNCSWDCTRDIIYSAIFTGISVINGSFIDDAEGWKKAIAILGTIGTAAVPIGFAIYGIIPGVIQESGDGKEAPQIPRLERATVLLSTARVKSRNLGQSRQRQNRFLNHERYIIRRCPLSQRFWFRH